MSNKRYARRDMLKARGKKLATARGLLLGLRQRPFGERFRIAWRILTGRMAGSIGAKIQRRWRGR